MSANTVEKDYAEVGSLAREIVAKRVTITAAVSAALDLALAEHWVSVSLSAHATSWLAIGLNGVAAVVGVLWSRDATTPADPALNPTSVAGEALVAIAGSAPRAARPLPIATPVSTAPVAADLASAAFTAAAAVAPVTTASAS